jgi:hypothetical protein
VQRFALLLAAVGLVGFPDLARDLGLGRDRALVGLAPLDLWAGSLVAVAAAREFPVVVVDRRVESLLRLVRFLLARCCCRLCVPLHAMMREGI